MKATTVTAPSPSVALATTLLARGQAAEAERMLRWLVQSRPKLAAAWHLLAVIATERGHADEAIALALRAIAQDARGAEFHVAHGRALKSAGRLEEAVVAYRRAIHQRPGFAEARVSLGIALRLLGQPEEAAAQYREALRLRPDFPEALTNLGNVLAERIGHAAGDSVTAEDLREAEQVQRRALALAPRNADSLHNLAVVLRLTGRTDEAADLFNRALAIDANRPQTCLQFGALLVDENRHDLARQLYTQWLAGRPPHTPVVLALAECLVDLGETDDALSWLDRLDAPGAATARSHHLRGRIGQRHFDHDLDAGQALATYAAAIDARPDYAEAVCSYLLTRCYLDTDPVALAAAHRARIAPVLAASPPRSRRAASRDAARRLRVGYVSADFKRHSVAYFLEALLTHRDPARHEVVAYKTNAGGDAVTARLLALCDRQVDAVASSDAQLAQCCRDDGIDVLIDLSGLTSGARLGMFARGAAPCQLTYLGYPTTTGADCFDFRLTDDVIDPAGSPAHGSEPLLRLPGGMFCYQPGELPPVAPPPARIRGHVTFGSFNNFSKAGPHTLALWREVLLAVPGSRLRLKGNAFLRRGNRDAVTRHFEARGIAAARIEFQPWMPDVQAHLAAYGDIDVALDTVPFNGATTTCEALVMGVPVVTLVGRTHPGRMGASILRAAGMRDLVADDASGYVRLAVALATDLSALADRRAAQRARLQASRLLDGPGFARDFESVLEAAFDACIARGDDATPG